MVNEWRGVARGQGVVVLAHADLAHVFRKVLPGAARMAVHHAGDVRVDEDVVDIQQLENLSLFVQNCADRRAARRIGNIDSVAQCVSARLDHVRQADVGESVVPVAAADIAVHAGEPDLGDPPGAGLVAIDHGGRKGHAIFVE